MIEEVKYIERDRIGKRIRALREKNKMSIYRLAELSGVERKTISSLEKGRWNITFDLLQKIADALNANVTLLEKHYETINENNLDSVL